MSEWTGKGSRSRVSDYRKYWNTFDNIKPLKTTYIQEKLPNRYLFLDDWRRPSQAYLQSEHMSLINCSKIPEKDWTIVRSYNEFVNYIEDNGIPDVVSFDNDLEISSKMDMDLENEMMRCGYYDHTKLSCKTGCHCAEYLVKKCLELNQDIPEYYVHTMNNLARLKILDVMKPSENINS